MTDKSKSSDYYCIHFNRLVTSQAQLQCRQVLAVTQAKVKVKANIPRLDSVIATENSRSEKKMNFDENS